MYFFYRSCSWKESKAAKLKKKSNFSQASDNDETGLVWVFLNPAFRGPGLKNAVFIFFFNNDFKAFASKSSTDNFLWRRVSRQHLVRRPTPSEAFVDALTRPQSKRIRAGMSVGWVWTWFLGRLCRLSTFYFTFFSLHAQQLRSPPDKISNHYTSRMFNGCSERSRMFVSFSWLLTGWDSTESCVLFS